MFLLQPSLVVFSIYILSSPLLVVPTVNEDDYLLQMKSKGFKAASDNGLRHVVVLLKDESVSEVRTYD